MGNSEINNEHSGQHPKSYGTHHCPNCGAGYHFSSIDGLKNSMTKPFMTCKNCDATYKISPSSDGKKATITLVDTPPNVLLSGKLAGYFDHPKLVLTSKCLIIGDRSIKLSEIIETYTEQERLRSSVVIQLANGSSEKLNISPEKSGSVLSALTFLSGDLAATESETRAFSKATADRWVNAINQQLRHKSESQTEMLEERIKELERKLNEKDNK
jgi:hypothetical protein